MTERDSSFRTPKELTVGTILKVEKFRETFFLHFLSESLTRIDSEKRILDEMKSTN